MEDKYFIDAYNKLKDKSPEAICNLYRNFYYKEGNNCERGIVAMAINDMMVKLAQYEKRLAYHDCEEGDTVYVLVQRDKDSDYTVYKAKIDDIQYAEYMIFTDSDGHYLRYFDDAFGDLIFLDEKDAEQMKEIKNANRVN